ncbi:hypothetical protein AC578_7421 [Pseudocercospora eumusae]|uniref:Uncharacterized protein n=1 Tax=Pseudocercospora eumusae TaxID=321146 RepID=A0A139H325_9PEZI|nr:hypothetical protein AC578_7421 [Pseudocercospora eumusae]
MTNNLSLAADRLRRARRRALAARLRIAALQYMQVQDIAARDSIRSSEDLTPDAIFALSDRTLEVSKAPNRIAHLRNKYVGREMEVEWAKKEVEDEEKLLEERFWESFRIGVE